MFYCIPSLTQLPILPETDASGFRMPETVKMHNAIRTKSAALGADAVILTEEGVLPNNRKWATGVAIKFQ